MTTERLLAKRIDDHYRATYGGTPENDGLWPSSNTAAPIRPDDPDFVREFVPENIHYRASNRYRWGYPPRNKETKMMNRLERRRHALNLRWLNKLKWYGATALGLFFGLPLVIKFSSLCWEWMLS